MSKIRYIEREKCFLLKKYFLLMVKILFSRKYCLLHVIVLKSARAKLNLFELQTSNVIQVCFEKVFIRELNLFCLQKCLIRI
jgi:hypothetical protein